MTEVSEAENKDQQKQVHSTLFSRRLLGYRLNSQSVNIFNENLTWTNEAKYLGVILDSKLT
jgi:hypothetical protein